MARSAAGESAFQLKEKSLELEARHFQSNDVAMRKTAQNRAMHRDEMQRAGAAHNRFAQGPEIGAALVEIFRAPANENFIGTWTRKEFSQERGVGGGHSDGSVETVTH